MFENPLYLVAIVPLAIILFWLIRKEIIRVDRRYTDEQRFATGRNWRRFALFISRLLVLSLLVVAVAGPFLERSELTDANPEMTLLIDNSTSMELLDTQFVDGFVEQLRERLPVTVRTIATRPRSPVGDDVLSYLADGSNVLLVTDGNVHEGASLEDISLFASSINATVNAISLEPVFNDAAIRIIGPEKVVSGINTTFIVDVTSTFDEDVNVQLLADDELLYEGPVDERGYAFVRTFTEGETLLRAQIMDADAVGQNDVFQRTVQVLKKPKILYVTKKGSQLTTILNQLYDAQIATRLPADLSEFYAVVIHDMPASDLSSNTDALVRYLSEGNGVIVIGGDSSYNNGAYANSVFETILPVRVGAAQRRSGDANIVVAIELSANTRGTVRQIINDDGSRSFVEVEEEQVGLQKSLAASVIGDLNPTNRVGVLGFIYGGPTQQCPPQGRCEIWPVQPLGKDKQAIIDAIGSLDVNGGTDISNGLFGALDMLQGISGSKNVILITDGSTGPLDRDESVQAAQRISALGGKLYTVQVRNLGGADVFLQELAATGGGIYFKADERNRLNILFGDPQPIDQGNAFDIFALDQYHFITRGVDVNGVLFSYNQVVPKPGSQLLVTSSAGDPVITVWNYGAGRVAAITGYSGKDLGELLAAPTSKVVTRTLNWGIGDPERKDPFSISVPDGFVGEPLSVVVRSDRLPSAPGVTFTPSGEDLYTAKIEARDGGVYSLLDNQYAVNYDREISRVGMHPDLAGALAVSGGKLFAPSDIDEIIDHVKNQQQLRRTSKQDLTFIAVLAALVIFFLEVAVRRIAALRRGR